MERKSMIKIKPKSPKAGEIAKVSLMVMHPMDTGLGKDKATKQTIPSHFINEIVFSWNGKPFTTIKGWETISANPFYEVMLKVPGDGKLSATFKDNKGENITKSKKVKVKS
jgi:sulfur-oxidizing protein SoxZ